ncbi:MAG: glycosyltransferase family A protein [Flavobacteriaceae bacterium]
MRIGANPLRNKKVKTNFYHRIIVPIFVPNLDDPYFENGLEVTQLCLQSLHKTRHSKSFLTVVNNGSCKEVTHFLQQMYLEGKIDQLVHFKENIGKIDAMIPIAREAQEPLITLTDGDVLFKEGWIQAVENVFLNFPKAGMVSPVPNPTFYRIYSENTLFDAFCKGLLKFKSVCQPEDLLAFAKSIGSETMYKKKSRLYKQLIVEQKGRQAVVGCGHFVATLRKEVFLKAPKSLSNMAYASAADRDYIDIPNDKAGFWRLATTNCYAYHIGNIPEPWMKSFEANLVSQNKTLDSIPKVKKSYLPLSIKKGVNKLWLNSYVRPFIFKYLGLDQGYNEY